MLHCTVTRWRGIAPPHSLRPVVQSAMATGEGNHLGDNFRDCHRPAWCLSDPRAASPHFRCHAKACPWHPGWVGRAKAARAEIISEIISDASHRYVLRRVLKGVPEISGGLGLFLPLKGGAVESSDPCCHLSVWPSPPTSSARRGSFVLYPEATPPQPQLLRRHRHRHALRPGHARRQRLEPAVIPQRPIVRIVPQRLEILVAQNLLV